ncbi:hypothetical protein ACJJIX_14420 [Microbulbifer sp. VAAC004]|uniref:hypothetical protein n=1 Tax=unclassified Microbulbifer TaxID=2619833 RepID=UPI00403903B1
MKVFTPKLSASIAAAGIALGSSTSALSQVTDSETSMITLTFMEMIDIAFVDNITIADPTPGDPAVGLDFFCVAGTGFSTFSINFVNPTTTGPDFLLNSANGSGPIMYNVFFKNDLSPGPGLPVTPDVPIPGNALQASACTAPSTDDNAKFDVEIPFPEWNGREGDGPFMGLLEITVTAE